MSRVVLLILLVFNIGLIYVSGDTINCSVDADCGNGECVNVYNSTGNVNKECRCDKGYTTFNDEVCEYEKKSQLVAFWMSFFTGGFGIDWFYLGDGDIAYDVVGAIKLILFVLLACLLSVRICDYVAAGFKFRVHYNDYWILILVLLWVVWWIVDWVRIINDPCNFKDSNGVCLEEW
jgi:hypothetical protein